MENCHASRMSGECFVSGGPSRGTMKPGRSYSAPSPTCSCSVTDSARNAFNDVMCGTENTAVLQCRIVNVGGCSSGKALAFRQVHRQLRARGHGGHGNLGPANRDHTYPDSAPGQRIIADNVFESGSSYGGRRGDTASAPASAPPRSSSATTSSSTTFRRPWSLRARPTSSITLRPTRSFRETSST